MTFVLNVLCELDLGIISWIIVLIPFFFMTIIASVILISLGMNKTTGPTNTEQIISPTIETPETKEIIYTSPPLSPWLLPDVPEQLQQEPSNNNTNNTNNSFPISNGLYLIM
jgi:ABC-type transport system involved in multi-copper enzyme maturation permease subunit